jgi:peptidoglycan hydrolase-like protein with peptidoglycan-binding domain/3D (Asp-Asp-Asp) domain-containing protein
MSTKNIKYWLSVTLSVMFSVMIFGSNMATVEADEDYYIQDFVISAYYSPVPGQSRYATGTYSGDIRLNGNGVHTADGTAVASMNGGFVAAPPNFPFGTKMDIDGLGVFVVHDRGGAIKGNRLDVWMGYGDEGLLEALTWGKRTVSVKVYADGADIKVKNVIKSTFGELPSYQKVEVADPMEFSRELELGDDGEDVARLQQFLKDELFFFGEVDGEFDEDTKEALEAFQKDTGLLDAPNFSEEGRFGSLTITKLERALVSTREEDLNGLPTRNLGRGSAGSQVRQLQEILVKLGYLKRVNGVYDSKTAAAVLEFQLDQGVIDDESDSGAGYYGPGTQLALQKIHFQLVGDVEDMTTETENNKERKVVEYLSEDELLNIDLSEGDEGAEVARLQEALRDLNLLRIDPTGQYGPMTTHAVFKFQQRMGYVKTKNDEKAGKLDAESRETINWYLNKKASILAQKKGKTTAKSIDRLNSATLLEEMTIGDRGPTVKRLQEFLRNEGYFDGKFATEYFGEGTKEALAEYQLENDLIVDLDSASAGVLNQETIDFINSRL